MDQSNRSTSRNNSSRESRLAADCWIGAIGQSDAPHTRPSAVRDDLDRLPLARVQSVAVPAQIPACEIAGHGATLCLGLLGSSQPVPGMPPPVQFHMRAGDALLFTHALWHGAAENNSERPRKTLIYGYIQRFLKPYDYEQAVPEVLSMCTPRQRLLLGELGGWHWRAGCHYYEAPDYLPTMLGTVRHEPNEPAPLRTAAQAGRPAQCAPEREVNHDGNEHDSCGYRDRSVEA